MNEKALKLPGLELYESSSKLGISERVKKGDLYRWVIGEAPPVLGEHSLAKHRILKEYLEKYVAILTHSGRAEQLTLSLVDGFSGGGRYLHSSTGERIAGSPLLMLDAMAVAEVRANERRRKGFRLNSNFYFVEQRKQTLEHLQKEVKASPSAVGKHDQIHFLHGTFSKHLDQIISNIKRKGTAHRTIFLLDQYGYTDVPLSSIRKIFSALPNAEVILTFAVDWLTHFVNDSPSFTTTLRNLELEHRQDLLVQLRKQHAPDWRAQIQHILHQHFFDRSGADCYTPFFVHSVESNRAYWLLHFSKHSTARDAMMELHWEMQNHFEHFGAAGFGMLGHDPRKISTEDQKTFAFDMDAKKATAEALLDEIPEKLRLHDGLIPYRNFFDLNVNDTPATKEMISSAVSRLAKEGALEVFSKNKKERQPGVKLNDSDLIQLPQTSFFPMWGS